MAGPPISLHTNPGLAFAVVHSISTLPSSDESAPYLIAFVASS